MLKFEVEKTCGRARLGHLHTAHGTVDTPAFMPVGTVGTVKAMMPESVAATGAQILLGNTYHLMLRPGADLVQKMGGLHKFMNWDKAILTDSGGFQVMSLSKLRKITEDGVEFRSHLDGSAHRLTPEISIEIQHKLDSNVTMCLDECPPYPCDRSYLAESTRRSMRWAKRSKDAFIDRDGYGIFGICQGGVHEDLRKESCESLIDIGFDGYAIGGLAVGEGQELMFDTIEKTTPHLPADKPRYLMGVGRPSDIIGSVLRGVDMFDCVMPSRSGRTAQAFTRTGVLNMRNKCHAEDDSPIDPKCSCPACRHYSRAYIRHLFQSKEILGCMLLTWHNIQYYEDLMRDIRQAIREDRLEEFAKGDFV